MANKTNIKTFVLNFDEVLFRCSKTAKRPLLLIVNEKNCKEELFKGYQVFEFELSKTNQTCKKCILNNYCSFSNTRRNKASPKEANNG